MRRAARGRGPPRGWAHGGLALLLLAPALACARSDAEWRRDLADPDPFVRALAAIALGVQSPREAGAAVPELLRTLDRPDVGLAEEAARALVQVGPFQVPVLLEQLLEDALLSAERRAAIRDALIAAGPPAVDPILACMRGPGSHLVGDLGQVLLAIGPAALPGIVGMLEQEPDVRLRSFAAFLLACMGPRARSALPALQAAATASDPELRRMAGEAISSLEGRPLRATVPGEARR